MSILDKIAKQRGTDKCSDIHNYCVKYEKYLPFKVDEKLNILEIGIHKGQSLLTWKDYYFNSKVIGIDINSECKQYEDLDNNIHVEIGSQYDGEFLKNVGEKYQQFDMILDDGSHINKHVIFSFQEMFKYVKSKGVYVIEDVCTSYWWDYEGGYRQEGTSMEYFKKLCDEVNFNGILNFNKPNVHARREDWCTENVKNEILDCRTDIESINFLNSIIIITKR